MLLENNQSITVKHYIYLKKMIKILCGADLSDVNEQLAPLKESCYRSLWSLQTTITLAEGALLIFSHSRFEKLLAWA